MEHIGAAALPIVIGIILVFAFFKGVNVFDLFVLGAKEGINTSFKILPTLIGLIVAVTMLRVSGLLDLLSAFILPIANAVGVSPEIAPLALLRPISGSGSSAYTLSVLKEFGADSETGMIASVLSASTETTFYAVAVYFGSLQYKKLYYTVPVALLGDAAAIVFSIISVKLL